MQNLEMAVAPFINILQPQTSLKIGPIIFGHYA